MKYIYIYKSQWYCKITGKTKPQPDISCHSIKRPCNIRLHLIDWRSRGSHGKSPKQPGCRQQYRLFSANLVTGPIAENNVHTAYRTYRRNKLLYCRKAAIPAAMANRKLTQWHHLWRFRVSKCQVGALPSVFIYFILSDCFLFLSYFYFFYFYPKSPCYIFCHFQFGDFNGIPECANDWVSLGHHQMTSCGSQWEVIPTNIRWVFSLTSTSLPTYGQSADSERRWSSRPEWDVFIRPIPSGLGDLSGKRRHNDFKRQRGWKTSRKKAFQPQQDRHTHELTKSGRVHTACDRLKPISTPNQEAICNWQPLAKEKLVFSSGVSVCRLLHLRAGPCPGVVGQHNTNSMVFCKTFILLALFGLGLRLLKAFPLGTSHSEEDCVNTGKWLPPTKPWATESCNFQPWEQVCQDIWAYQAWSQSLP